MEGDRKPNQRCLVLNADYSPITIATVQRALYLLLDQNADLVEAGEPPLRSPSVTMERPLVVVLRKYRKVPRGRSIPLTTRTVLARDGYECAYQRPDLCEGRASTIDHIIPRSKGGPHTWQNTIASCRPCNARKGRKTLKELGWELKFQPFKPEGPFARLLMHSTEPAWTKYFRGK